MTVNTKAIRESIKHEAQNLVDTCRKLFGRLIHSPRSDMRMKIDLF